ncbi:hypothetical protein HMPREF0201_04675 [Cedecea davisae DSM 4568]|uniref:Uncharacterized protein n=1 Tax=Cedecea davisae DSM 4568 TaxID=566551 RepID=S3IZI0_9ENTR|nr:hypothetical protein HMPREF0201_04675 [Cedecea davisae DSM 4568]
MQTLKTVLRYRFAFISETFRCRSHFFNLVVVLSAPHFLHSSSAKRFASGAGK